MSKTITKELDDLWKKLVRLRAGGECEICQSTNVLQAHHIISRTYYGVRWNEENGVLLCRKHHLYHAHKVGSGFEDWIAERRPMEKLKALKHSKTDKPAALIYLKKEIKKLDF